MPLLKSPVTGTVWKIEASPGQALAEGATVLVVESMKMEIPVEMPAAGTLRTIRVAEGARIAQGQLLAEYD